MAVYVDPMSPCIQSKKWPYDQACHLIADSVEELQEFAMTLGLHPSWFQAAGGSMPHYDLVGSMRRRAIRLGAIQIDRKEFVKIMEKYRQRKTGGRRD